MVTRPFILACLLPSLLIACKPDDDGRASLVTSARVIGVRMVPAEAAAGAKVTLEALRLGPEGPDNAAELPFDLCVVRKPLAESSPVAPECLLSDVDNPALVSLGSGLSVTAQLPSDACSIFGPKTPTPEPGQTAQRPADPDTTGGYYQPFRVDDQGAFTVGSARLACGLGGASQESSIEFSKRYRKNENPAIASMSATTDSGITNLDFITPITLSPGTQVVFSVNWASCPTTDTCGDGICGIDETSSDCKADCATPTGCTGAETYLLQDPDTKALISQRETLRVSWYVTGGNLERDRTGRTSSETETTTENTWTAPSIPGTYWLAVVIRDDRGGTGWVTQPLQINN